MPLKNLPDCPDSKYADARTAIGALGVLNERNFLHATKCPRCCNRNEYSLKKIYSQYAAPDDFKAYYSDW